MPKIKNLEGLTTEEINAELNNGAKFVMFQYCISIILLTFKRSSNIYFVKAGQSSVKHSIGFTIITALFGWWDFHGAQFTLYKPCTLICLAEQT